MTERSRRQRKPAGLLHPRPAAGLLLRYMDLDGARYLLGKRHRRLGGTWANIGGTLNPGESPLAGAVREFREEVGVDVTHLVRTVAAVAESGTERVPYTLFVVDVPTRIESAELSWENDELDWWHADDIAMLPLHPGFARAWATLQANRRL